MTTDQTNMRVEDRLAERLKGADFAQWFGEDDIRDLVAKALDKAFFNERPNPNGGYNAPARVPPLLVEVAQTHLREKIDTYAAEHIKKLFADDPVLIERVLAAAVDKTLEDVVTKAIANLIGFVIAGQDFNMQERIRQALGR
jgi:hypothetical protein